MLQLTMTVKSSTENRALKKVKLFSTHTGICMSVENENCFYLLMHSPASGNFYHLYALKDMKKMHLQKAKKKNMIIKNNYIWLH